MEEELESATFQIYGMSWNDTVKLTFWMHYQMDDLGVLGANMANNRKWPSSTFSRPNIRP